MTRSRNDDAIRRAVRRRATEETVGRLEQALRRGGPIEMAVKRADDLLRSGPNVNATSSMMGFLGVLHVQELLLREALLRLRQHLDDEERAEDDAPAEE